MMTRAFLGVDESLFMYCILITFGSIALNVSLKSHQSFAHMMINPNHYVAPVFNN
jgi:hypothetical protein